MLALGSPLEFPTLGRHSPDVSTVAPVSAAPHETAPSPRREARRPRWQLAFYATSSPGANVLRRQQGAGHAQARNASKVRAFIAGKCNESDVLKVTANCIALCGDRTADALACFKELDRAVHEQTGERVRPDVAVYNALISSFESAGEHELADSHLGQAMKDGVFHLALGYSRTRNTLDLHRRAVEPGAEGESNGICADVARTIFRRLHKDRTVNLDTQFVVGYHGGHQVKDAIRECMEAVGWPARHPIHGGHPNEGRWVVDHALMKRQGSGAENDRRGVALPMPMPMPRALSLRTCGEVMGSGTAFIG
jgi:hypothetical protein